MADYPENAFRDILQDISETIKSKRCLNRDEKIVAGWIEQAGNEIQTEEERRGKTEYERYLRYLVEINKKLPKEIRKPSCTQEYTEEIYSIPSTSKVLCPRKDIIEQFAPTADVEGVQQVIGQVKNGDITTAPEFIFAIAPFTKDQAKSFQEILEKDSRIFREIVEDTANRRVQDEADVMMHTQNDIKEKFQSISEATIQRTMRIRERLFELSSSFDWATDGKDRARLSGLIKTAINKRKEMSRDPCATDQTMHQVFMRSQWLKKELIRLQEENASLKLYLEKFKLLAAERKAQELHVPRMLCKEKKELEEELNVQRKLYKRNLEIIDALYVERQRCMKPCNEG